MKLKTMTVKKEVKKIVTVKTTEKYSDALARIQTIINRELKINGEDCVKVGNKDCTRCVLGTSLTPPGHQCISSRVNDIFNDAILKCKLNDI